METSSTPSVLIELLSLETGIDPKKIHEKTKLEDLGIDSLGFIDLMQLIGEKFKPIPQEKYIEIETVGDLLKLILSLS